MVCRDLRGALSAAGSIRRLVPVYDLTDPDMMPESERQYERPEEPEVEEVEAEEGAELDEIEQAFVDEVLDAIRAPDEVT